MWVGHSSFVSRLRSRFYETVDRSDDSTSQCEDHKISEFTVCGGTGLDLVEMGRTADHVVSTDVHV